MGTSVQTVFGTEDPDPVYSSDLGPQILMALMFQFFVVSNPKNTLTKKEKDCENAVKDEKFSPNFLFFVIKFFLFPFPRYS